MKVFEVNDPCKKTLQTTIPDPVIKFIKDIDPKTKTTRTGDGACAKDSTKIGQKNKSSMAEDDNAKDSQEDEIELDF